MDYKLIIPVVSLIVCAACYFDFRREQITLREMKAVRPLYDPPRLFGLSPRRMIVGLAVAQALVFQL